MHTLSRDKNAAFDFCEAEYFLAYKDGWYTGQKMKVLCILAKKNESVNMFRLIKMIDPQAFVSQSAVIGVYGEGFDEMNVKIKQEKKKEKELTAKEK